MGKRPARSAAFSPLSPCSAAVLDHRLTVWLHTLTRRATSLWLNPCRNSLNPSSRRRSSASKSRLTPRGLPIAVMAHRTNRSLLYIMRDSVDHSPGERSDETYVRVAG